MKVTFNSSSTNPITVEEFLEPTFCTWAIKQDRQNPDPDVDIIDTHTIYLDEYTAKELIRTLKFMLHRDEIEKY